MGVNMISTFDYRAVDTSNIFDCNWTQTQNHLVHKPSLNHLVKLTKWLSCVLSNYLHGAFDCMFLSCHVRNSEWIQTLYLHECPGTPCWKHVQNLKFKWLQLDSNPEPLSLWKNTKLFGKTDQIIELCSQYLSVRCIWMSVLVMSCMHFRVIPHSIVDWMARKSLLEASAKSEVSVIATELKPRTS